MDLAWKTRLLHACITYNNAALFHSSRRSAILLACSKRLLTQHKSRTHSESPDPSLVPVSWVGSGHETNQTLFPGETVESGYM